jgi:hypothetical protein
MPQRSKNIFNIFFLTMKYTAMPIGIASHDALVYEKPMAIRNTSRPKPRMQFLKMFEL